MSEPLPVERPRAPLYAIPAAFFVLMGTLGVAFMPYLLARAPLVLVAMSPLFRHIVLASPSVEALPLFAVAVPRHFAPDIFVYYLGREYGPAAIEWVEASSPMLGKMARGLERLFMRVGPVALLFSPDLVVSTIAGAARVSLPVFVVVNIAGTFATVAVARWFGDALEGPIRALMAFFQANLLSVTVASVLLVVLLNRFSRRRAASEDE